MFVFLLLRVSVSAYPDKREGITSQAKELLFL
jgi:hypothetical protein